MWVAEGTMAVCSSDQLFRSDQGSIRGQGEPMVCDLGLFFARDFSKCAKVESAGGALVMPARSGPRERRSAPLLRPAAQRSGKIWACLKIYTRV